MGMESGRGCECEGPGQAYTWFRVQGSGFRVSVWGVVKAYSNLRSMCVCVCVCVCVCACARVGGTCATVYLRNRFAYAAAARTRTRTYT